MSLSENQKENHLPKNPKYKITYQTNSPVYAYDSININFTPEMARFSCFVISQQTEEQIASGLKGKQNTEFPVLPHHVFQITPSCALQVMTIIADLSNKSGYLKLLTIDSKNKLIEHTRNFLEILENSVVETQEKPEK